MGTQALVIDDAATVRLYHRGLLESCGLEVDQAENGMEGLERLNAKPYDLVLVDVNMPVMDGYRFVEEMRHAAINRAAPVVMISTESEAHDLDRAFSAGVNAYLVKPVTPERLSHMVELLVEKDS